MQAKRKSDDKGDKKQSLFDKIVEFVKNLGPIPLTLAGAAAALFAFSQDVRTAVKGILGNFGQGISNFLDWLKNGGENGPLNIPIRYAC